MKEQQRKLLHICLWCVIGLFIIRCALSWKSVVTGVSIYELLGYASEAISVAVIFSGVYEKFLWRFVPCENTPKLARQYSGTIKSNYDHVERTASLTVKQTLLSTHITLTTDESTSVSVSAIIKDVLGETQLIYCYLNKPKAEYRDRSEIHYGTAVFTITDAKTLEGSYYTDRNTRGDMKFIAKN